MSLKNFNSYAGKKPLKLKDFQEYLPKDTMIAAHFIFDNVLFSDAWNAATYDEYETALVNMLTETAIAPSKRRSPNRFESTYLSVNIYNKFGERNLFSRYFEMIDKWDGTQEDYEVVERFMINDILSCIYNNRYKWANLMKSTMLEFNPLWNVDAEEITTRTLEQDGTIQNAKTGTETTHVTGTETNNKTGTETSKKTGTETDVKTGTETNAKTGTERTLTDETTEDKKTGTETIVKTGSEQLTYNTTDTTAFVGSEATTHKKAITNEESVTTTESSEFFKTKKTIESGIDDDNVDTLEYSPDRANTETKTGTETTAFNSRQDQTTYNTTDTIDHDNDVTLTYNTQDQLTHNTTDTLTHNTTDQLTHLTQDQLTHNTTDQLTHNTTDTETRDLLDTERILHERHGNIGVTQSVTLLDSFQKFVDFRVIDVVAHDIANAITYGVY